MKIINVKKLNELSGAIPLHEYEDVIAQTDQFNQDDFIPILLGLYGEVGSVMTASKKYKREKKGYPEFRESVEEELGDTLWYFTALCRRLNFKIGDIFDSAIKDINVSVISANDQPSAPISKIVSVNMERELDISLIKLGCAASELLKEDSLSEDSEKKLIHFASIYLEAIQSIGLVFSKIIKNNLIKAFGRFSSLDLKNIPDFDEKFSEEEQLPREFEIHILQRNSGQSYLKWNGVFIGSPLADNISDLDGYRFHDVFHLAYATVLHWSPTFRALIKHKRKSNALFDENQDGGRAIVVEEGLTAWLFSYAKGLDYFEGHDGVSFDILKTIQKFVQGYEVEQCPLKLWEYAILEGYSVFRQVKKNNGGIVIGDRNNRKIIYKSINKIGENKSDTMQLCIT